MKELIRLFNILGPAHSERLRRLREYKMKEAIRIPEDDTNLGLSVKMFPNKGRGVIADKSFVKDDFIVEYSGDLLTFKEWKIREKAYKENSEIGSYVVKFKHNDKICFLDATKETPRLGRLVNHSRVHANCTLKKVVIDQKPHIILVASKDIESGTEIRYDYMDRDSASLMHNPWLSKKQELKMSENKRGR
jgi:histone-lysine N-methyltransferase SETD8